MILNLHESPNENNYWGRQKKEQTEVKGLHEKVDIRTKDLITDQKILVEMFDNHYINVVEETPGIAPKNLGNPLDPKVNEKTIR